MVSRMRHAGFVNGTDVFNNSCFHIAKAEAMAMDPQQRLVLELGYEALHTAGYTQASLEETVTGVFLGIQALEFPSLLQGTPAGAGVYSATGTAHAIACGRVSFSLGLQGPCAAYDSACSSGLVAAHAASSALSLGDCPSGIAAGINLMLQPTTSLGCAVAGMTSALGRCHTFDSRADGYARSEGCAVFVLRQRGEYSLIGVALVICGSAVRSDGRSASLTAPNGQAQQQLRLAAHVSADARPSAVVEAHGTGTALGDPIEVGSYAAVARSLGGASDALGSIKANVAHSEPAAGTTGLLKLASHLQNLLAAPNAQLRVLNRSVINALAHLDSVSHVQPSRLCMASAGGQVSSFGYGGTIAHALVNREVVVAATAAPTAVDLLAAGPPHGMLWYRRYYQWREPVHPFVEQQVPTTHRPLPTTHRPLTTTLYPLPTYPLPTTHYPLLTAPLRRWRLVRTAARRSARWRLAQCAPSSRTMSCSVVWCSPAQAILSSRAQRAAAPHPSQARVLAPSS